MAGYIDSEASWVLAVSEGQIIEARAFQSDTLGLSPWYRTKWTLAERERYLRVQIWAMAQCDLEVTRRLLQAMLEATEQDLQGRQEEIDAGVELLGSSLKGIEDDRAEFSGTISSDCAAEFQG